MAFVIKTAKTLRNHWKKTTFFTVVLAWGGSYTKNHFETQNLMKAYCERATFYGNQTIPVLLNPRTITVILNPNANKRKAQADFDKFCAPLLHLAGLSVEIVKTESEGHAKKIMEQLNGTEAIVVAGGDGTLSEVVTGLLRYTNEKSVVPVGILPLGKNNTVAKSLFPAYCGSKLEKVKSLADATMAIIEEVTKQMDVMRIEILNSEEVKPVYAVANIKWGAYRDAEMKKEKYWYFGGLKKYATYFFNGLKSSISWNCEAQLSYTPPCTGCSNCHKPPVQPKSKWFQSFVKESEETLKYQRIHNPHCTEQQEKTISTSDLTVFTSNVIPSRIEDAQPPKLSLLIGPDKVDFVDFVKQGWKSEQGESREVKEEIEARMVEINPVKTGKELWFSIDNEDFEVKPIRVTLLPKLLRVYAKKEVH